jgi:hypothetical protein
MARKTGAHGTDCKGLCDKGEPGFIIFLPLAESVVTFTALTADRPGTLLCGRQKSMNKLAFSPMSD